MYDAGMMAGLLALGGIVVFFFSIIGIAMYVLFSLGLMKLAENKGIENPWLAWIPIANMYILGLIVKEVDVFGQKITKLELVLPISCAIGLFAAIPVIGQLLVLAYGIFMIFVLLKLFKMYRPEQAVLYTVLSVILGLFSIFIFIIRNDSPVNVE